MKKAGRVIKWLVINGAMAACLWYGAVEGVQGAQNILVFFTWLTAVVYSVVQADAQIKGMDKLPDASPVPVWLCRGFDMTMQAALVWFGWWWTAAAYFVQFAALASYRDKVEKERKARATPLEVV